LVIWNALVDPRPVKEIAKHTGVSVSSVHNLVWLYNKLGPGAIEAPKESKRRRCYLSREQEAQFLGSFIERSRTGQIAVASQIKEALEERLGHDVHHSTIYRMLGRNGWRKVVPRPVHVQSKQQVQEDFKKTSRKS